MIACISIDQTHANSSHGWSKNNGIVTNDKSSITFLLTWIVILSSFVAVLSVFMLIRFVRWIRIYRMTSRSRRIRRFPQKKSCDESVFSTVLHTNKTYSQSLCLLREWIDLEDQIGQGCFGQVFKGQLRRPDTGLDQDPSYINKNNSETVAVKIFKNQTCSSSLAATEQEELIREAEIMAALSHENILALRGIVFNGNSILTLLYHIPLLELSFD